MQLYLVGRMPLYLVGQNREKPPKSKNATLSGYLVMQLYLVFSMPLMSTGTVHTVCGVLELHFAPPRAGALVCCRGALRLHEGSRPLRDALRGALERR